MPGPVITLGGRDVADYVGALEQLIAAWEDEPWWDEGDGEIVVGDHVWRVESSHVAGKLTAELDDHGVRVLRHEVAVVARRMWLIDRAFACE